MQRLELSSATTCSLTAGTTVLVPLGSIEQHGPHLPLDTDTVIAMAVATAAAETLKADGHDVVVAPPIYYGASGEHQGFPGTSSIGTDVLRHVLIELTRSMRVWAHQVVFVNAHGGNIDALRPALDQLITEGHAVSWVPCKTEKADLHAGRTETSLMLHLRPWDVRMDRAEAGNAASLQELMPPMRAGGVRAVSPNGVLGDPTGASPREGRDLLEVMVREVEQVVRLVLESKHSRQ